MASPSQNVRVILADDHMIVRQGLKAILEKHHFEVVGEASDGHAAIRLCQTSQPEVAILDIGMPMLNGVDAAREIGRLCPAVKIILLTVYEDEACVLAGLRAGATGYVLKSDAFSSLVQAIEAASNGQIYLSPGVTGTLVKAYFSRASLPPADPLTARERQVLQLIAEGLNMKEIGAALGISRKTADTHRGRIMQKLEIPNTAGLVRYAQKNGLILETAADPGVRTMIQSATGKD
jgi:DNA-binding NarL/FixJ family response regulator